MLAAVEAEGLAVVTPTARAAQLTMDREGIRRLAAEELGLPTSRHGFAHSLEQRRAAIGGGRDAGGIAFEGLADALAVPRSDQRLFGKPEAFVKRSMGVAVANGEDKRRAPEPAQLAASRVRPVAG